MSQSVLSLLILAGIIFCFASRVIPLGITAVLGSLAMAVVGITTFSEAIAPFGSDTVLLILGMIVVGNALTETGLTDMIGRKLMRIPGVGNHEKLFLMVVLSVVAVLSGFISNTAAVAIFLPLVAGIAKTSKGTITKKNTYMAIGISSVIGGNLTLAGSTPQIVAQGILSQTDGCTPMNFFDLTKGCIPLLITMLVYYGTIGYTLQKKKFRFEEKWDNAATGAVEKPAAHRGKAVICGIIFAWCIVGFVCNIFTLGTVAIIAACACVATKCISIERAAATMDWTSILVLGGSMGFSAGLDQSGALQLIADKIIHIVGESAPIFLIFAVFLVLAAVMGNVMSHTATTAILVPIAITVAKELGSNPTLFAIAIVIGCNLAFATPVSTPPLTMTLNGGYRFGDYVVVGGVLNILCLIVALATLPVLYGI